MDGYVLIGFLAGGIIGSLLTLLITWQSTRRQAEEKTHALIESRQEAFMAIASHYLLTPLSLIQGAVTRLNEKPHLELSDRQILYDTVLTGQKRLYIISEQMLLATKLVNGELSMSPKVGLLHNVAFEALKDIEPLAHHKNISINNQIQQLPPIECEYDPHHLKIALVALLDNAIKFSSENSAIVLTVARHENVAFLEVSDSGIGMTAEQKAHATEKFYRGTPPYVFDYEGMGLGLHVAYRIMQAHGGDINVSSDGPNKGATITLLLPLSR